MNEYYLLQSQSIFRTQTVCIGCGRTVWPDFSFLQAAVLHLLAGCQLIIYDNFAQVMKLK